MTTELTKTQRDEEKARKNGRTVYIAISLAFAVIIIALAFFNVEKSMLIIIIAMFGGTLAILAPNLMKSKKKE